MKIAKIGYIVFSVIFFAFGAIAILLPEPAFPIFGKLCGVGMIIFGGIKLVGYFSKDLYRLAFQFDMQFGILLILIGLIVLFKTSDVLNFLPIALGVLILIDGLFKIRIAFDAKSFGIKVWWVLFIMSLVCEALGVTLLFRPSERAYFPIVLIGISLIAEGCLNMFMVISMVKIVKYQMPDKISDNMLYDDNNI